MESGLSNVFIIIVGGMKVSGHFRQEGFAPFSNNHLRHAHGKRVDALFENRPNDCRFFVLMNNGTAEHAHKVATGLANRGHQAHVRMHSFYRFFFNGQVEQRFYITIYNSLAGHQFRLISCKYFSANSFCALSLLKFFSNTREAISKEIAAAWAFASRKTFCFAAWASALPSALIFSASCSAAARFCA